MSKFFNQTAKTGNPPPNAEALEVTGLREILASLGTPEAPTSDLGDVRLERCREVRMQLNEQVHGIFGGGEAARAAEESYRALRTRLLRLRSAQGLRTVVVTSATAGEGKTFVSLNLALCCSQLQDFRVLLVDGDVRTSGLSRMMGLSAGPGLVDVVSGKCEPEDAVVATEFPNLFLMNSGSPTAQPANMFAGSKWQEFIGWCNESFKLVLVDSPPALNLTDVELILAPCDGVLVVVRAQHAKRELLLKCAAQIDAKKLLGLVYNGVERPKGGHYPYGAYIGSRKESSEAQEHIPGT